MLASSRSTTRRETRKSRNDSRDARSVRVDLARFDVVRELRREADMRLAVCAAIALAGLTALACGGVNMSDDQRGPSRGATFGADDGDDESADDDRDASTKTKTNEQDATPPATVAPADAGAPDTSTPEPVPAGSFAAGTDLETTADLNLRDGPATTFAVIVTMPAGSAVKVKTTSGADGWVNVDFQGTVGYASKTYLVVP